jgi:hypothetical protein
MNSVSATILRTNVNVVQVTSEGCNYYITFVDAQGNLKITRGLIDNSVSATSLGTSAKVN